ncbi:MAG: fasciclin domain-containing protein [Cyclobacteriaceae bacterium]|jgi:uncharacterized surface protein with fasciclin (FAS1) repeats|nr:fasciclin domain-containing protein [Cyclobacteriaceae bacterium]
MKTILFVIACLAWGGCERPKHETSTTVANLPQEEGQASVQDDESQHDLVKIAANSADHTTLVAALRAAEYLDVLANAGPFTVFAPTNAAFAKLPAGTLEMLTNPENKEQLRTLLEYHVYVGVLTETMIRDGMVINMVSLDNATLAKKDSKITINGAAVLGSARGSNGIVYIIDSVLLLPEKSNLKFPL